MKACEPSSPSPAGVRPCSRPRRSSTKANSPTCASSSPALAAVAAPRPVAEHGDRRGHRLDARGRGPPRPGPAAARSSRKRTSSSVPIDRKNVAENRICSGSTSPSACAEWRDSLTTRPGEERPERHRDPGQRREVGGAEAQRDHRQQEHLGGAGAGDRLEHRRHDPPGHDEGDGDDGAGGGQRADETAGAAALLAPAEHRQQQHHRDDREVLEDEQPEAGLAGRRARGAAVAEQLEHDRRRRQRDEQAGEDRRPQLDAGEHEQPGRDRRPPTGPAASRRAAPAGGCPSAGRSRTRCRS